MRGSLRGLRSGNGGIHVHFERDESGYWQIVDGKIIPYHKSAVDDHWDNQRDEIRKFIQAKQGGGIKFGSGILHDSDQESNTDTVDYVITQWQDTISHGIVGYDYGSKNHIIYSIKRKSDNLEFSVDEITEQGKIKEFRMWDKVIQVYTLEGCYYLWQLTKKKDNAVLFTIDEILSKFPDTAFNQKIIREEFEELAKQKMQS